MSQNIVRIFLANQLSI